MTEINDLISIPEAAELLHVSKARLRKLCAEGRIRRYWKGKRVRGVVLTDVLTFKRMKPWGTRRKS